MLYGMTTRFRCADPSQLWHLWDIFGIAHADMIGYWHPHPPITSTCDAVLVSTYMIHGNRSLIALASWEPERRTCALKIDYAALGLSPPHVRAYLPELNSLGQPGPEELELRASDGYQAVLTVAASDGGVIVLEKRA